jgi:hypothetical protein
MMFGYQSGARGKAKVDCPKKKIGHTTLMAIFIGENHGSMDVNRSVSQQTTGMKAMLHLILEITEALLAFYPRLVYHSPFMDRSIINPNEIGVKDQVSLVS